MLHNLKSKLQEASKLKFTFETEVKRQMSFLDSSITRISEGGFTTKVHVKPTSSDNVINYRSIYPERYKTGVIKTLLNRSYKVCTSEELFNLEIKRLKQVFTNNNFPMQVVDNEIANFFRKIQSQTGAENVEGVDLFYRSPMTSQCRQEEKCLNDLVRM